MESKICKQCQKDFEISDTDLEFYKKISPTFAGKTFEIPAPTMCPKCRAWRRLAFRNERNFYKRQSSDGKEIISVFSLDKKYPVYSQEQWWSDQWDPLSFGQDFDSSRSFFEQFSELMQKVPRIALMHRNSENCDYTNVCADNRDCYILIESSNNEKCYFSYWMQLSNSCMDCAFCNKCELCYEVTNSDNCYSLKYSRSCTNCRDSYFLLNCIGCSDCFGCVNLNQRQYYIYNQPHSKEEYSAKIAELNLSDLDSIDKLKEEAKSFWLKHPRKFAEILNSENCSGCYITHSKDLKNCFSAYEARNCTNCVHVWRDAKDNMDVDTAGINSQLNYESINTALNSYANSFSIRCWTCSNMFYCDNCDFSKNCFGCTGLRHKEYCILNKQYSKDEYEQKVAEIIEKMTVAGEWGEFLPVKFSLFGYNETVANDYYPMTKQEAEAMGAKWQDNDFAIEYNGQEFVPESIDKYSDPAEQQRLLSAVLKCPVSGKPFKIMPQELAFYIEQKIPVPRKHYNVRFIERISNINPRELYHRQCMCEETEHGHDGQCKEEFETTYAPDRSEKVYCESCYQKSVI